MAVAADRRRAVDQLDAVGCLDASQCADQGAGGGADGDRRFVDGQGRRRRPVPIGEIADAAIERVQAAGEPPGVDDEVAGRMGGMMGGLRIPGFGG